MAEPMVPRMRTVPQAVLELRKIDPMSAVTEYYLNRLLKAGKLPYYQSGRKRFINFDILLKYLSDIEFTESPE